MSNLSNFSPQFDLSFIQKNDKRGPRYTSYPTADHFRDFLPQEAQIHLQKRAKNPVNEALSLYFHLPFCRTICYFCACNKIITQDHGRSAKYIRYVAKELALLADFLPEEKRQVAQLHWGGGSPTFLSDDEMALLMEATRKHFSLSETGEFSIEIDPRRVTKKTIQHLANLGFNRISLGVQDFDLDVQTAIHRVQTEDETRAVVDAARENGFGSISFDLIYGLPKQSEKSFTNTLERTLLMNPDRLSIYNYAHLPQIFKPQRRIFDQDLPSAETRLKLLALSVNTLINAGYVYIGMDHFAKPSDELAIAQRENRLHRNFQGYSTHADCDLLSFGISAISKISGSYYQNYKTLDDYYQRLDEGILPVFRGISLNQDDLLRRQIIQNLMCHEVLNFADIENEFSIIFADYFKSELNALKNHAEEGLIKLSARQIKITPRGHFVVRTIAMIFDAHLQKGQEIKRYSKLI